MIRRIRTMAYRYVCLHFRSPARVLDIFFWPAMELLLWGFFSVYLQQQLPGGGRRVLPALFSGLIFWDVLFRSQQSVSLALMEELWSRNILNLLITPLRTWEWVVSVCVYGFMKTGIVVGFLLVLAGALYSFNLSILGFYLIPFLMNLLLMGWAVGLFTSGLLLRWGYAAEALIWGVPFLIQPFSAIFYPLSVYPDWLKPLCLLLPSTYVMEGMRALVLQSVFSWPQFVMALAINAAYLIGCAFFSACMLERGRSTGQLIRLTS